MAATLSILELQSVFMEARGDIERTIRRRVGSPQIAADLTQDLFLRLQRITTPLSDRHHARAYLFSMAGNLATDHIRVEGRRTEIIAGIATLFNGVDNGPEHDVLAREQLRVVDEALSELPPRCKDVLYMSRMLGMTHSEIAAELGVSRSLVEKYAIRALLHCRMRLREVAAEPARCAG